MKNKSIDYEEGLVSESGNWNTAKIFSSMKIAKLILDIDEYRKVCRHGTSELIDEYTTTEEQKIQAKIWAMERYIETTKMIIDNSLFGIKFDDDKTLLKEYYKIIELIEGLYPSSYKERPFLKINEFYPIIYKTLVMINRDILSPLNRSDMIFTTVQDVDVNKLKEDFMNRFETEG